MALQGGTVLVFGISSPEKSYGLILDYNTEDAVNRAEAIASDGEIVSIQEHGQQKQLNLNYLPLDASATADGKPAIGDPFVYEGEIWRINSITDGLSVDGFKTVSVNASYYKKLGEVEE